MGIQLGSPYVPPDGTTLNTNSSGQLEIKKGTEGDILYADSGGSFVKLPIGTSEKFLSSSGTAPQWVTKPGIGWSLLETLTPSAVANVTSSALAVCDLYYVVVNVYGGAGGGIIYLQLGDGSIDTGANYNECRIANTSIQQNASATQITLSGINPLTWSACSATIAGTSDATRTVIGVSCQGSLDQSGGVTGISGNWAAGASKQIDLIKIGTLSGTITGTIQIYGMNI